MRINENTLDLDTFVEYALGIGINMEIVELHKKVLLELCEEFRGFHLEGIGIKYVSIKKYLVPFFEVWHRNMPNVPKRMTSAFFNADFDTQNPRVSRNLEIDRLTPPNKKGVVFIVQGSDLEEEIDKGLYFIPNTEINIAEKRFIKQKSVHIRPIQVSQATML